MARISEAEFRRYLEDILPQSDLCALLALCTQRDPEGVTNKDMEANMHIHLPPGRQVTYVATNPRIPYAMKVRKSLGIGRFVFIDGYPHQYRLTFDGLCLAFEVFVRRYPHLNVRPSCGRSHTASTLS